MTQLTNLRRSNPIVLPPLFFLVVRTIFRQALGALGHQVCNE